MANTLPHPSVWPSVVFLPRQLSSSWHSPLLPSSMLHMPRIYKKLLENWFEPSHGILVLFDLPKLILQTHMRSHPVGLDVWFLVRHFVYFHTLCVKALARPVACVVSTKISWAGSFGFYSSLDQIYFKYYRLLCFHAFLFHGFVITEKWARVWQNQQNDLCTQRRLRSTAWASDQTGCMSRLIWFIIGCTSFCWFCHAT